MSPKFRVLELYSGIGGMHWALKKSGVDFKVVMAVDINTTANLIYEHNFPSTDLQSFGLEKLTLHKLESLDINTILMSPPCQPFTRVGKKRDCEDVRTKSFLHILQLIGKMKVKPAYLLVENVKGFEMSLTRKMLIECLENCGYTYQEFLLTPLQFGIPNCRLRYYLIAKWKYPFVFAVQSQVMTDLSKITEAASASKVYSNTSACQECNLEGSRSFLHSANCVNHSEDGKAFIPHCQPFSIQPVTDKTSICCMAENVQSETNYSEANQEICSTTKFSELKNAGRNMRYCEEDDSYIYAGSRSLRDFMESASFDELKEYWLTDKEMKMFVIMDIVFPDLKKSTCFTKRYGHYVDGAGSLVQMSSDVEDVRAASELKSNAVKLRNRLQWGDKELEVIRKLKLRYFTPREVANLLCFPVEFDFPQQVSRIQKYRLLGNSLNVLVVAELIKLMAEESGTK